MMVVPIGNGCNGINAARLQRASARLVKLQQNLEPDHIRSKPYLQFPNPERESFRRRPDRRRGSILRQSPRKITMWASSRYIANIVRRHGKPGFAFVAFKRNRANLFQPHHDLAFKRHVARSVSRQAGSADGPLAPPISRSADCAAIHSRASLGRGAACCAPACAGVESLAQKLLICFSQNGNATAATSLLIILSCL